MLLGENLTLAVLDLKMAGGQPDPLDARRNSNVSFLPMRNSAIFKLEEPLLIVRMRLSCAGII